VRVGKGHPSVGRDAIVVINEDTVRAFTLTLSSLSIFRVKERDAYSMKVSGLYLSSDSCFYSLRIGRRYRYHLYFGVGETAFVEMFYGMGKCLEGDTGLVVLEYLPFPPGEIVDACGRYLLVVKRGLCGVYLYRRCRDRIYPVSTQPFYGECFIAPPYLYSFEHGLYLYSLDGRLLYSKDRVGVKVVGDSLVFGVYYPSPEERGIYGVFILKDDSLAFCPYDYILKGIIGTRGRNIYIFDGKELSLWHCSFFWEE